MAVLFVVTEHSTLNMSSSFKIRVFRWTEPYSHCFMFYFEICFCNNKQIKAHGLNWIVWNCYKVVNKWLNGKWAALALSKLHANVNILKYLSNRRGMQTPLSHHVFDPEHYSMNSPQYHTNLCVDILKE